MISVSQTYKESSVFIVFGYCILSTGKQLKMYTRTCFCSIIGYQKLGFKWQQSIKHSLV